METAGCSIMKGRTRAIIVLLGSVILIAVLASSIIYGYSRWTRYRELKGKYAAPPSGMVFIPPGEFIMGSDSPEAEPDEHPRRYVYVGPFYIDRCEVTNSEYRKIFPRHTYPEGEDSLPVTGVNRYEAMAYARAIGKRIPTNAEWEKAARGTDGRIYPWGDKFLPGHANIREKDGAVFDKSGKTLTAKCVILTGHKAAVGSFPSGASPYGTLDMAGNVWEWVADDYMQRGFSAGLLKQEPRGILRGGAYGYGTFNARSSYQGFEDPNSSCNDTGFRCAKTATITDN